MEQPITSLSLMALTAVCLAASVAALRGLRRREARATRGVTAAMTLLVVGSAVLLGARWWHAGELFQPLHAHVDGLLLITMLLGAALLFLRWRPRMLTVSAFGLPLLVLLYAWAVCAAAWTYRPFKLETLTPVWSWLHLIGVYVGTLCFVIGAVAAAAYLYVHHRIKRKDDPGSIGRLPPLETLEHLVIRSATLGFAILTVGLVGGIVVIAQHPDAIGPNGWVIAKFALAGAVWLLYGLLINLRFATSFRGTRAAWLSIAGLVLLIMTYGLITALPTNQEAKKNNPAAVSSEHRSRTAFSYSYSKRSLIGVRERATKTIKARQELLPCV